MGSQLPPGYLHPRAFPDPRLTPNGPTPSLLSHPGTISDDRIHRGSRANKIWKPPWVLCVFPLPHRVSHEELWLFLLKVSGFAHFPPCLRLPEHPFLRHPGCSPDPGLCRLLPGYCMVFLTAFALSTHVPYTDFKPAARAPLRQKRYRNSPVFETLWRCPCFTQSKS